MRGLGAVLPGLGRPGAWCGGRAAARALLLRGVCAPLTVAPGAGLTASQANRMFGR
ncbi:protein of unknown function [Streptantibioticus cattleyicolor NRRL 8057 = DSM 46488]|nr:protein of unknown function [Streptantibioticus cattleyicolor NRRL 8057 = DSM 46488]